jgi:hypothetical protein
VRAHAAEAEGVAVRGCPRAAARSDAPGGARQVLDNNGLPQRDPHALGHETRSEIERRAGRQGHDHRERAEREVLCAILSLGDGDACPGGRGDQQNPHAASIGWRHNGLHVRGCEPLFRMSDSIGDRLC